MTRPHHLNRADRSLRESVVRSGRGDVLGPLAGPQASLVPSVPGTHGSGPGPVEKTDLSTRQPAAEPTAPGVDAYLAARRLDALAARPLHELAALFRCLECDAGPGAPCMAADRPHRPRLEIAADARDEWLALRSPEGLRARRTWNRRIAGLAPSTALYRAAHGLEGIDR